MGNFLTSCACIKHIFVYIQDRHHILPEYADGGLVGPDGSLVSVQGMYIDFQVIHVWPDGLLGIDFFCNLSGQLITMRRCVQITGIQEYDGIDQDLGTIFQGASAARLHIERDRGHLYIGRVYVTRDGITFDVADYLRSRRVPPTDNELVRTTASIPTLPVQDFRDPEIVHSAELIKRPSLDEKMPELVVPEGSTIPTVPVDPSSSTHVLPAFPVSTEIVELKIVDPEMSDPEMIEEVGDDSHEISKSIGEFNLIEDQFVFTSQ